MPQEHELWQALELQQEVTELCTCDFRKWMKKECLEGKRSIKFMIPWELFSRMMLELVEF